MNINILPNLPPLKAGWSLVKLAEICEIIMGQSPPSSTYNTIGIGLPFFQGKAEFSELHPVTKKWCSNPKKIAEANDILLSIRAPVGSTNIANKKCCIGRGLTAIRYPDCYKYIFYFFRFVEKDLDKLGTGTTFKAISSKTLYELNIPLPPLSEQKKIVTKIEELFSELDNGIEQLKKAKEQIKIYKQSVLSHAFSGRPVHVNQKSTAGGESRQRRKVKNQNEMLKAVEPEVEYENNGLPEGWKWTKLGNVLEVKDGTHDTPKYIGKGIPFITQKNIKNGEFIFDNYNLISENDHNKFYKRSNVAYNDIIISMIGANRGMSTIVKTKEIFSIKNVGLIKANEKKILSKFLDYFFKSEQGQKSILSRSKGGAQQFIGLTELRNWVVPFLSISEQYQIVEEIESRFSVEDKLEQTIDESLKKSETLRQSILKQAFEGKLLNSR